MPEEASDPQAPVSSGQKDQKEQMALPIWVGEGMDEQEANLMASGVDCRVIVLVGDVDSGKTTLVSAIWELLNSGPLFGWSFAGSKTMVGFESRCFLSRSESENETPETQRTSRVEAGRFLHLAIKSMGKERQNLLIYDVTGESYQAANANSDDCKALPFFSRADHITVLIDGRKMCSITERLNEKTKIYRLLRRCLDCGAIGTDTCLSIGVSKWDTVAACLDRDNTSSFIDHTQKEFELLLKGKVKAYDFCSFASRSGTAESNMHIKLGHGIDALLACWTRSPAMHFAQSGPDNCAQIDRFVATTSIRETVQ